MTDEINVIFNCYYDMCLSFDGYTDEKVIRCSPEPETMKLESSLENPRTPPAYFTDELSTKYIVPLIIFGFLSLPAIVIWLYICGESNHSGHW